jgi:hypothetical protein
MPIPKLLLHSELRESETAAVEHAITIVDHLAYHPLTIAAAGHILICEDCHCGSSELNMTDSKSKY